MKIEGGGDEGRTSPKHEVGRNVMLAIASQRVVVMLASQRASTKSRVKNKPASFRRDSNSNSNPSWQEKETLINKPRSSYIPQATSLN